VNSRPLLVRLAILAGIVLFVGLLSRKLPPGDPRPPGPRLAVLVVFDQLRGDYLMRWRPLFEEGGFRRLEDEGAWFVDCHYPYSHTVTGCGHASLATGSTPSKHGISGNEWYDRQSEKSINCVGSSSYELRPAPVEGLSPLGKKPRGAAPDRLRAQTLADALKAATNGQGRVVSLSFKDRSAVLPGGQRPDACYWVDDTSGAVVTSTYYRQWPHDWVADFNRSHFADHWRGGLWARLRSNIDYERYAGSDYVPASDIRFRAGMVLSPTFPHTLTAPPGVPGGFTDLFYSSPFGNDFLLDLTKRAIDAEHLGQGPQPDLLCVSFSSNDAVGHVWGPDSHEVLDVTLRSDRIVKELLNYLDAKVGKGRYVLALSSDHGICPLPEVSRRRGQPAMRIPPKDLKDEAEAFLRVRYGDADRWLLAFQDDWFFLDRASLEQRRLPKKEVADSLARWLESQSGIARAYTREQLLRNRPTDRIDQLVQQSFVPDRSGDVLALTKPYSFFFPVPSGTTHGSPYAYDTHVPLLVYGPGIPGGVRREAVSPLAAAPILAEALGIGKLADAEAAVPASLRRPVAAGQRVEMPGY
jgi:hypothetical protein